MEEYILAVVVGLIVVSLIARVVLITGLSNAEGRCSDTDAVMLISLTSIITTCTVGLLIIGLWCAYNAGIADAANLTEAQSARASCDWMNGYEPSDPWLSELPSTDRSDDLTPEDLAKVRSDDAGAVWLGKKQSAE